MKHLLLLSLLATTVLGDTITNYIVDSQGRPVNGTVSLTLTNAPQALTTKYVVSTKINVPVVNGVWIATNMVNGYYWVKQPYDDARLVLMPTGSATNSFAYYVNMAGGGVPTFSTVPGAVGNSAPFTHNLAVTRSVARPTVPYLIADDDFAFDIDDMYGLAMGFSLADDGYLIPIMLLSSDDPVGDYASAPLADAFTRYYGYTCVVAGPSTGFAGINAWNRIYGVPTIAKYAHAITYGTNAVSALRALRKTLANCPANSIKWVLGGAVRNLYDLWNSPADDISSLTGPELIKRGIQELIIISGFYPKTTNMCERAELTNFDLDPESAFVATNNFGVLTTFLGVEIGNAIVTDHHAAVSNRVNGDIMKYMSQISEGYYASNNAGALYFNRESWTAPAYLYAAFGTNYNGMQLFNYVQGWLNLYSATPCYLSISNNWTADPFGPHRYLTLSQTPTFYANIMNGYLAKPGAVNNAPSIMGSVPTSDQLTVISNGFAITTGDWSITNLPPSIRFIGDSAPSGLLTTWPDSGPQGYTGTPIYTPVGIYKSNNIVNGHSTVYFGSTAGYTNTFASGLAGNTLPFTMWAVVWPQYANSNNTILSSFSYEFRVYNNRLDFNLANLQNIAASSPGGIQSSNWYIVAMTYNAAGRWSFWINGQLDSRGTNYIAGPVVSGTYIGNNAGIGMFGGHIAEIGKTGRELTDAEMGKLFTELNKTYTIYNASPPTITPYGSITAFSQNNGILSLWTPAILSPTVWLQPSSLLTNQTRLTSWADSSGNANAFADASTNNGGWNGTALNGYPTLLLSATNLTRFVSTNLLMNQRPFTVWTVLNCTNLTLTNTILGEAGGNYAIRLYNSKLNLSVPNVNDVGSSATSLSANTWYLLALSYDVAGNARFYINGNLDAVVANNIAPSGPTGAYLGSESSVKDWFGGSIAELGRVNTVLGTNDIVYLFDYLNIKYGLYPRGVVSSGNLLVNGNLGINTASPTRAVEIVGNNPYISLNETNTSDRETGLRFAQSGVAKWLVGPDVATSSGSSDLQFYGNTLGANVMTLATNGNVGIGSTSPSNLLQLNSAATPSVGQMKITANNAGGIGLFSYAPNNAVISFDSEYTGSLWVARDTSATSIQKIAGQLNFYGNSGLTIGNSFTPTLRLSLDPSSGTLNLYGHQLWANDNTYDIGGLASNRPRDVNIGRNLQVGSELTVYNGSCAIASSGEFIFNGRGGMIAAGDGLFRFINNAATDFNRLQFGGGTYSFPALQRSGTTLNVVLADGSAYTTIQAGNMLPNGNILFGTDNTFDIGASGSSRPRNLYVAGGAALGGSIGIGSGGYFYWGSRSQIASPVDGIISFVNAAGTDFTRLQFGGTTASYPAIGKSSTTLTATLADASAYTTFRASNFEAASTGGLKATDASGLNAGGLNLNLAGGVSTGTANGGAIIFNTGTNGASGSTVNQTIVRGYIAPHAVALTKSSATTVFNVTCPISVLVGGAFNYSIICSNATDFQMHSGTVNFSAVNKTGTVTGAIAEAATLEAVAVSTGTFTDTWTAVANGNSVDIKVNAVPSLTPSVLYCYWSIDHMASSVPVTITPQ